MSLLVKRLSPLLDLHRSLDSIYNSKPIDEISDEISDIVVSTYRYNFTVKYISGKDNNLADFLSRNPIWCQEQEDHGPWIIDDFGKKITVEAHISSVQSMDKRDFTLILCLNTSVTKEPWTTSIQPWSRQYNKNKQKTGSSTQVTIHVVSMPLCGRDWEL